MNFVCNGKNNKGTRCNNFVTKPEGYCRFHIKLLTNKNKIILPTPINNIQSLNSNNIDTNNGTLYNVIDCPICLCEIEKNEEDSGLICKHRFHIECFNHLQKAECPVCRGPLEFIKSSKIDVNKIKNKEQQENRSKEQRQIIEDSDLSRRIQNERNDNFNHNHRTHRNRNNNNFVINMNGMFHNIIFTLEELEELEELQELRELEEIQQINQAIENSLMTVNSNKR